MSRNVHTVIFSNYTIAAGASGLCDLHLQEFDNVQFLLEMTYGHTNASAAGVTLKLKGGFGTLDKTDPNLVSGSVLYALSPGMARPVFADNYSTVADMPTFSLNSSSSQTKRLNFYLDSIGIRWPSWCRIEFTNTDILNPVTLTLRADL